MSPFESNFIYSTEKRFLCMTSRDGVRSILLDNLEQIESQTRNSSHLSAQCDSLHAYSVISKNKL